MYIYYFHYHLYVHSDKSRYKTASEAGYYDPYNMFLIGDSGGFLLNIKPGYKFINTELFSPMAKIYNETGEYIVDPIQVTNNNIKIDICH